MKPGSLIYLTLSVCCIASIAKSASLLSKDPFLGIAPQDEKYYKSSRDIIICKDGSNKFTRAQLNDDFCDCSDGSDEPGTSACPSGKFYCQNAGHVPLSFFSSRVNDGICDCCDGSDEYDGKVKCPNTCWEAGKVARDKLKKKISTYQEGVTLRTLEVEQAKLAIAKDETELSKLKNEEKILKGLVQQLKERKEQIEKAEEAERLQREKEEKAKKEAEGEVNQDNTKAEKEEDKEEEKPMDSTHDDRIGILEDSPLDQDVAEHHDDSVAGVEHGDYPGNEGSPTNEIEQHAVEETEAFAHETGLDAGSEVSADEVVELGRDVSENNEALSREELGRRVASRWTGENIGQQTGEVHAVKENEHEGHEETPTDAHDEEDDGYASETDDDNQRYDDDDIEDHIDEDFGEEDHDDSSSSYKSDSDDESDFSDTTTPRNPSWLEKIQHTVRNILQAVNFFQTPVDKSEAAHVRKEYDESNAKLSKIQSRISSLTQKLKHDFGPEKEFYSFYDRCFESKQNKYVYKVCPFKQASQVEGHSTTRLGRWEKFEDSYRVMLFLNGDKCWNGPDRSLKVKLRCGLKNEVTDIDEPSRCEYIALLSTPALCLEEKLMELQHKLELMNKEQPRRHDEL
ncbi:hypothetical protein L1049_018258 [Liquidambar formosana]|uniref:Glucosidase 2 subunit beta n=1 Tax=Liquidambar formosana TaxID=63359 RepID=A0AAP0R9X0_LIQFO